jgi:glycerate kinase
MEMAAAAGLPLVEGRRDPLHATTRGVGELLRRAEELGVRRVLLGLGGSCTNDCGIGMAAALGFRFMDASGREVEPLAANLGDIRTIREPERPLSIKVSAACDVDNPLLGPAGATYTFGPQKGADRETLDRLEAGMTSFRQVLTRHYGASLAETPGTGAAGGMGEAVLRLLGGTLRPGIELLLDAAGFDDLLQGADLVLTGEGRIDRQSAHGKVPMGVGLRCKRAGVPCLALCGSVGPGAEAVYDCGITAIFSAVQGAASFEEIRKTAAGDMAFLTDSVLRMLCHFPTKGI